LSTNYTFRDKSDYLPYSYSSEWEDEKSIKYYMTNMSFPLCFHHFLLFTYRHTSGFEGQVWERPWEKWGLRVGGRWWQRLAMATWLATPVVTDGWVGGDPWEGRTRGDNHGSKCLRKELTINVFIYCQLEIITLVIISITNSSLHVI